MALRTLAVAAFCLMLSGVEAEHNQAQVPICKFHRKGKKAPKQEYEEICELKEKIDEILEDGEPLVFKDYCVGMCPNGGVAATYDFGTNSYGNVCDTPSAGAFDYTTITGCTHTDDHDDDHTETDTHDDEHTETDEADDSLSRGSSGFQLAHDSYSYDSAAITGGMAVISGFLGVICVLLVGHVYMLHKLRKVLHNRAAF